MLPLSSVPGVVGVEQLQAGLEVGQEWKGVSGGCSLSREPEILTEELVQLLLPELDSEKVEGGVEEVGRTGDLVLSLAEPRDGVKQVAVRTTEHPLGAQHAGRHLLADEELVAGGVLPVVAGLAARVQGA